MDNGGAGLPAHVEKYITTAAGPARDSCRAKNSTEPARFIELALLVTVCTTG
jgi:hypothetical protein